MKQDRLLCAAAFRLNIPPSYDKYMEWGFFDGSVRFYAADSRKVWVFYPLLLLQAALMDVAAWALRAFAHWSTLLCYLRGLPDVDHLRHGLHDIHLDI